MNTTFLVSSASNRPAVILEKALCTKGFIGTAKGSPSGESSRGRG